MLRRVRFSLFLLICACTVLASTLPISSAQVRTALAPLAAPLTGGPDAFGYTWDSSAPFAGIDATGDVEVPGGDVDIQDVMLVVAHWGESCTQDLPAAAPLSGADLAPGIAVFPASSTQGMGEAFDLQVQVQDVTDLGGVEFTLRFDPTVLHVQGAELGAMLQGTARTFGALGPNIDNTAGSVHFGAWSFGPTPPGPSGAGSVAVIHWQAVSAGSSQVQFSTQRPPQITNSQGVVQTLASVSGAEVAVSGQQPTRTPTRTPEHTPTGTPTRTRTPAATPSGTQPARRVYLPALIKRGTQVQ